MMHAELGPDMVSKILDHMKAAHIGNTPVEEIDANGNIYAKIEWENRFGSIKDRPAFFIMDYLKSKGVLEGKAIVEASSGNTGLAISTISSMLGLQSCIVLPENASQATKKIIVENGSQLILTPPDLGTEGSIEKARSLASSGSFYWINQHSNPLNSDVHYYSTAPELLDQEGMPEAIVAGVGTGGTITGIARYFKERDPSVKVIGVQPSLYSHIPGLRDIKKTSNKGLIDLYGSYIDDFLYVKESDAIAEVFDHYVNTGELIGISSGANLYASKQLSSKFKKIFTVFPDSGRKYLDILKPYDKNNVLNY
ncbi:cysteine synthase [Thermoplasma volcanium GSS1]|uniref:Cysteine synthase n=1 Tax=Thermoplasma volcanium (strain ATCC 51530 / DSM 4299 / JCM 9571 / NBRC 15438 / GSS1) TaxID=273116 RepID=Q97B69_THEVO|nr:PLP-dependent cysteine synthase family protein [Thermoplasma volcanium]BAB59731.1 cysteine synthase [Thermoplasma volcanium GSS1]